MSKKYGKNLEFFLQRSWQTLSDQSFDQSAARSLKLAGLEDEKKDNLTDKRLEYHHSTNSIKEEETKKKMYKCN